MTSIVYSGGHWSPNIGNAFFNLGILNALKQAVPEAAVHFVADPPGWFWKQCRKPDYEDILLNDLTCDYLIISGPLYCKETVQIWGQTLRKLTARGTRIIFLSAGAIRYDDQEYQQVVPFLKEIKPYLVITRDSKTFERYGEYAEHAHDGICFAFFSNDVIEQPLNLAGNDINLCFDKGHDYDVLSVYQNELTGFLDRGDWPNDYPTKPLKRSRGASKITDFAGHRVVRPHHAPNPFFTRRMKSAILGYGPFSRPNTLAADTPQSYLYQYQRAPLTISERVHACVPALAFGNHAWLISDTPRSRLFDRVGLTEATQRPVKADLQLIAEEKQKMVSVISKVIR